MYLTNIVAFSMMSNVCYECFLSVAFWDSLICRGGYMWFAGLVKFWLSVW